MTASRTWRSLVVCGLLAALGGCPKPVEDAAPTGANATSSATATPSATAVAPGQAATAVSSEPVETFALLNAAASGDMSAMRADFERLERDPEAGPWATYNLGVLAYREGRQAEAIQKFEQALGSMPDLAPALVALVRVHLRDGNVAAARRAFSDAVSRSENDPGIAAAELYITLHEQRYDDVIRDARAVLLRDEGNEDVFYTLAMAYLRTGRHDLAQYIVDQGLGRDAANVSFYLVRAQLHLLDDNLAAAQTALSRAVELDGQNAEAHNNLGLVRLRLRNYARAQESFESATTYAPNYAEAWLNLGNAKKGQLDYAGAEAAFQRALQLRPGYGDAYYNLALLYLDAEMPGHTRETRLVQSLTYFDQAASSGSGAPELAAYRAEAQGLLDTERTLGSGADAFGESDPFGDGAAADPFGDAGADPFGDAAADPFGDEAAPGDADGSGDEAGEATTDGAESPPSDAGTTDEGGDEWEGGETW